MERLLHYVWKNRLIPRSGLKTTAGEDVIVLSPGLHNTDAGPDFFNADIIIGGADWMGNVEIHTKSSEWYRHNHDKDKAYNNVVLHIVEQADTEVFTESGRKVPQLVLGVPEDVVNNYERLQAYDDNPSCYQYAAQIPTLIYSRWMSRLCEERLERKAADIESRLHYCESDWERTFFITMARAFGFGLNSDTFEQWARTIPFGGAAKHRDNLLQIEALFLGQAGFLEGEPNDVDMLSATLPEVKYQDLKSEYRFLASKFSLTSITRHSWKFLRTRPQNFPTVRLAQFAKLYYKRKLRLSVVLEAEGPEEIRKVFDDINMPQASVNVLIINAVIPFFYAYGRYRGNSRMQAKALKWLAVMPAEDNKYTRKFKLNSSPVADPERSINTAADSQAIIQLVTRYCERRDCLRCQLGYQYIKKSG
ncbi:MAG: DUF2851 family protein [Bacteroidaceae bacterium]|nr:DUF2851 family protein [Bacteroidaceae bacterium]